MAIVNITRIISDLPYFEERIVNILPEILQFKTVTYQREKYGFHLLNWIEKWKVWTLPITEKVSRGE